VYALFFVALRPWREGLVAGVGGVARWRIENIDSVEMKAIVGRGTEIREREGRRFRVGEAIKIAVIACERQTRNPNALMSARVHSIYMPDPRRRLKSKLHRVIPIKRYRRRLALIVNGWASNDRASIMRVVKACSKCPKHLRRARVKNKIKMLNEVAKSQR